MKTVTVGGYFPPANTSDLPIKAIDYIKKCEYDYIEVMYDPTDTLKAYESIKSSNVLTLSKAMPLVAVALHMAASLTETLTAEAVFIITIYCIILIRFQPYK
jgi:hypothetical protein